MQQNSAAPLFWVFAGPNGSGKSTAYSSAKVEDEISRIWIINPDLLTVTIQRTENLELSAANLAAVQRIEVWLRATLLVHRSVGVETVLSTDKYREIVTLAKSLGFRFQLFFVMLNSPELNIERVASRVLKGGHDVPRDKIVDRYWRSLAQLPWFVTEAESAEIYDNSGAEPQLVARKAGGDLIVAPNAPANLHKVLIG